MQQDELVRMSTQIAQFFEPYPETEAVAGVEDHLRKFWDPSMRDRLFAMHRAGKVTLHPLVIQAVDRLLAGSAV
jgi:formate dehydrogenase subunit delta